MRSFFPLVLLAAPGQFAVDLTVPRQGFVNRTTELNIDHEVATGFDGIGGSSVRDFSQRGLALGDIDGDGDVDAVLCGGLLPNTVLRNDGGGFSDITDLAGIDVGDFDTAPCLADYDGDGDLDLFIGVLADGVGKLPVQPASRFYRNDGTGSFEEITALTGTRGGGHSIFAQWADLNLDGLLDLLVSEFYTQPNHVYRNNGDGTFTDVSVAWGLNALGSTHATCVLDCDDDGLPDVLVGNDYILSLWTSLPDNTPDRHLRGQDDSTWIDVSSGSGFDHQRGIMGLAIGDVDYDGDYDVYKTDVVENRLAINRGWPDSGSPWLGEEQAAYGIECGWVPWTEDPSGQGRLIGWGASFQDFNFDLWLDLLVINGQVSGATPTVQYSPRDQPNYLYTGAGPGAGFAFTDSTKQLGLHDEIDDRCCAIADMDQDGDLDIWITPTVGKARYFENRIDPGGQGWLMVKPVCRTSAPGGFGVEVMFTDSLGHPHTRQIGLDGSTAAQHENFAYFGLGTEPFVDLTVAFPSGVRLSLPGVTPNQVLTPVEPLLVEVSARTQPISFNPWTALVRNTPGLGSGPPGVYAVTAYAHDASGMPLGETASVTIKTPGLKPLTPVLSLGGNEFRRYFRAPWKPGEYRSEVSFDGWTCKIRPSVHFFDPGDASGTTALVVPEAVRAGSSDTFDVIIAPKSASGVSLGPGSSLAVQVGGQQSIAGPTDLGDGRYVATFGAPSLPAVYPISVAVNGAAVTSLGLRVDVGGAPSPSGSEVRVETPIPLNSASPWQLKVLVTPRDSRGRRMGPYASVNLVPMPDLGSPAVTVRMSSPQASQPDGSFAFIVEKPSTSPPTPASGFLQIFIDGVDLPPIGYSF